MKFVKLKKNDVCIGLQNSGQKKRFTEKYEPKSYKAPLAVLTVAAFMLTLFSGCASSSYRFRNARPITEYNDRKPIPVPKAQDSEKATYIYNVLVRRPAVKGFEIPNVEPSGDVNSMDEVPSSSWFTPRLGYVEISPEQLLNGPVKIGPPQAPIKVIKVKTSGNPGFVISDARGKRYLLKFDPPGFPGIETTTALIVNRLYWGFGYNVPEDYLYFVGREDLNIDTDSELTPETVDAVLSQVAAPENGRYRATVSLWLEGKVLGPIPDKGLRKDDPNDKIPHENRRVLRALRVFNAFTNHTDMRIDNSLDVYVGSAGRGYVQHFLLDFGEAFAGHGAEHDYLWDGFNHIFSFKQAYKNLVSLGLYVYPWENIHYTPWQSVGAFESQIFKPENWKEIYPYEPIRRSQRADNYWAAKILGALSREHIKTLVTAADYPEKEAAEYMIETLMQRREKVLRYYLTQVTPVDALAFIEGKLQLQDMRNFLLKDDDAHAKYEARFYNDRGQEIAEKYEFNSNSAIFTIPIRDALVENAGGYLRMDIAAWYDGKKTPAAQFHFRAENNSTPVLVGVVH